MTDDRSYFIGLVLMRIYQDFNASTLHPKLLQLIQQRRFFFVMSIARTCKFADGHSLKNWVIYLPKCHYKKAWFPQPDGRRRVYWVFSKCQCLRHLGDVTLVLSKKRRNDGPKATKILVTNLPEVA